VIKKEKIEKLVEFTLKKRKKKIQIFVYKKNDKIFEKKNIDHGV